jgi:hypothetical protein
MMPWQSVLCILHLQRRETYFVRKNSCSKKPKSKGVAKKKWSLDGIRCMNPDPRKSKPVFCISTGKQAWLPEQCAKNSPFMIYAIALYQSIVSRGLWKRRFPASQYSQPLARPGRTPRGHSSSCFDHECTLSIERLHIDGAIYSNSCSFDPVRFANQENVTNIMNKCTR